MYRVGIDIGGTFTDMLLVGEDGAAGIAKTLTTPGDPSLAVENALRPALENGAIDKSERGMLIHGTTLVTNALIERKGALTALLTTAGFRDAVEIGREHRYELYDLNLDLPKPLVPRHLRFDVPERMDADGNVLAALNEPFVRKLVGELRDKGIKVHDTLIGPLVTCQEMAGFSLSLTKLDDELKQLWNMECSSVCYTKLKS